MSSNLIARSSWFYHSFSLMREAVDNKENPQKPLNIANYPKPGHHIVLVFKCCTECRFSGYDSVTPLRTHGSKYHSPTPKSEQFDRRTTARHPAGGGLFLKSCQRAKNISSRLPDIGKAAHVEHWRRPEHIPCRCTIVSVCVQTETPRCCSGNAERTRTKGKEND